MVTFEAKDLRRLEDIKSQSGKEIGLATKQSKLIKDPAKATRRWLASVAIFGDNHPVTNIFASRKDELNGADTILIKADKVIRIEAKKPETTGEAKIKREQSDFPIGCKIKSGEKIGTVISHDTENDSISVDFEGSIEFVNIYTIKRF